MKIIKVEIFSLLNKNWALWKNHDAKKNLGILRILILPYHLRHLIKVDKKIHLCPKSFWALWEKIGQFGNFYIAQ